MPKEADGRAEGRFLTRELDEAGVGAVIERNWWGTLAAVENGRPYAVPVVYGWDGEHAYVISHPGRKTRLLEVNPRVCLTIVEVEERGADWFSVVIEGRAEFVRDPRGYVRAVTSLRRQVGREGPPPSARELARLARAKVIRIVPKAVTGRRKA